MSEKYTHIPIRANDNKIYCQKIRSQSYLSYNARAVKIYNAERSLARFEHKNNLSAFKNALAYYIQRYPPGANPTTSEFTTATPVLW
jgi:hypothetical protein